MDLACVKEIVPTRRRNLTIGGSACAAVFVRSLFDAVVDIHRLAYYLLGLVVVRSMRFGADDLLLQAIDISRLSIYIVGSDRLSRSRPQTKHRADGKVR